MAMSSSPATGIGALVLAAGAAQRFGGPKLLARDRGTSLLGRSVMAAREAGCDPVLVVVGAHAERLRTELRRVPAVCVTNRQWRRGVGSSIACGVTEIQRLAPALSGVLILVADQPKLDVAILERLLAAFDGTPGCRVASAYADTLGVPAIFGRTHFPALERLDGDRGAKALLLAGREGVLSVVWPEGARDIDLRDDAEGAGLTLPRKRGDGA